MNLLLALLLAAGVSQRADVLEERCDLIELNHFHNDEGRHVFDQVIFYDWSPRDCRFIVRDWRMVKGNWFFERDHARDEHVALGLDFDRAFVDVPLRHRRVTAPCFRESWTQDDPELLEREILPKERRRGLRVPLL